MSVNLDFALNNLTAASADVDKWAGQLHDAQKRLAKAKNDLEEATAELYGEGAVAGRNVEEREACVFRLTAGERYALREAEEEAALARFALGKAERNREDAREALRTARVQFMADRGLEVAA